MVEFNDVELGVIREILFGHAGAPNVIDVGALAHRFHVVGHVFYGEAGADARYAFVQKLQGVDLRAPTSDTAAAAAQVVQEIREYCEYIFSPQWLADPQNRSIFAAYVYGIIRDGATAATPAPAEAQDVAVAPAPLSFKCAGYGWHFKTADELARLRAENAALKNARDTLYVERNEIEKQWRGQAVELRDTLQLLREARTHVAYDSTLTQRIAIAAQELLPRIDKTLSVERDVFYTDAALNGIPGGGKIPPLPPQVISMRSSPMDETTTPDELRRKAESAQKLYAPKSWQEIDRSVAGDLQSMQKPVVPPAPGTIFKHYKTGNTYRKLFETCKEDGGEKAGWQEYFLMAATVTTDGPDDQKKAWLYSLPTGGVVVFIIDAMTEANHHFAAYIGVVYIALDGDSAGRIFFRAKDEFEGLTCRGDPKREPHPMLPNVYVPRFQDVTVKP